MYLCNECLRCFFDPAVSRELVKTDLGDELYMSTQCPYCGGTFEAAEHCSCGGVKYKGETLCVACRARLKEKFIKFADELTAEEEEQLDNWLDGNSVTERRKFA